MNSISHLYLESSGEMTHLSEPAWSWLWPEGPPSGGRMTLDRFRRLKEPEPQPELREPDPELLPEPEPAEPPALLALALSKPELTFIALPIQSTFPAAYPTGRPGIGDREGEIRGRPGRPGKGETKARIRSDQWRGIVEIMRPSIASTHQ